MLRTVKIFNGSKTNPSFSTKLQQFDSASNSWVEIPEVWISKEDQKKYEAAVNLEYIRSSR